MWLFRPARLDEATEACMVVRRSIEELCFADHGGDQAILDRWLANKTPAQMRGWISADPASIILGLGPDGIVGVGSILPGGKIALNYVAPWARRQGVSKGLMRAMEQQALEAGHAVCTLTSTMTAYGFYLAYGYRDKGAPTCSFGGKPTFPMCRALTAGNCGDRR